MIISGLFDEDGNSLNIELQDEGKDLHLDGCLYLPAGIDPHVHFRCPGGEDKEDWQTGSHAAFEGGYTFVCDMPNTNPACTTIKNLYDKIVMINHELSDYPLKYRLYFGASKEGLNEIENLEPFRAKIAGIKIFMGSSTGSLLLDDQESLEKVFKLAAENDFLVAVHAEDETLISERGSLPYPYKNSPRYHSFLRNDEVAAKAVSRAIDLAKRHQTKLYILHVSTKKEVELIEGAKKEGVQVFAEVTPHHLFLSDEFYATHGTKALVNPPLRNSGEQEFLFDAIERGVIDSLGSDHAPHPLSEKMKPFGEAPSGMPGIEWTFALLFQAHMDKKISLKNLVRLTSSGPRKILRLPNFNDHVIIDPNFEKVIPKQTISKASWTPYEGMKLKGWPIATIANGKLYKTSNMNKREISYI